MSVRAFSRPLLIGLVLSLASTPAITAPDEALVVTELPDPDPDFVPPPAPKGSERARYPGSAVVMVSSITSDVKDKVAQSQARLKLEEIDIQRQMCVTIRAARDAGIAHPEWEGRCAGF